MAEWLYDPETGEYTRADQLSSDSYTVIGDGVIDETGQARMYEFPKWTTEYAVPALLARGLSNVASGVGGLAKLAGDATDSPSISDWGDEIRQKARDWTAQAREDRGIAPGSGWDIAQGLGGDLATSGPLVARALLSQGGKLGLGAALSVFPSGEKYGDLRDVGVDPGPAALGAGESFAANTLLNLADVSSLMKPSGASSALGAMYRRAVPITATNVGTSELATLNDALIDKYAGVPQTEEQLKANLQNNALAGLGTGLAFTGLSALPQVVRSKTSGPSVDDFLSAIERQAPPPPSEPPGAGPGQGKGSLLLDADLPIVRSKTGKTKDSLLDITPPEPPVIQVEEGSRARTPLEIAEARLIQDFYAPLSARNAEMRRLEDIFMPKGTELEGFRSSLPEGTLSPLTLQKDKIVKPFTVDGEVSKRLTPEERNISNFVLEESGRRRVQSQVAEDMAQIAERRAARKSFGGNEADLVIKAPDEQSSFPEPVTILEPQSASPGEGQIVPVEGYAARSPEKIVEAQQTIRDVSWDVFKKSEFTQAEPPSQPASLAAKPSGPEMKLYVDGIEGKEIPYSDVPLGNEAFQYAIGRTAEDGSAAVFRRPGNQRGTYGGWRWEADATSVQRRAIGTRMATKRRKPVKSSEAGYIDLSWLADAILPSRKAQMFPGFKGHSASNEKYSKAWSQHLEWMTTTHKTQPQARGYIESYWRVPQDQSAIAWDANETAKPFLEMPKEVAAPVGKYLAAARILTQRDPSYQVTAENAAKAGLNPEQVKAALAVNEWSKGFNETLRAEALDASEHELFKDLIRAESEPRKKAAQTMAANRAAEINARFDEMAQANYVPFSHYGQFYIRVFGKDGELTHRFDFDKKSDPEFAKAFNHYSKLAKEQGLKPPEWGQIPPAKLSEYDGVPSDIISLLNSGAEPSQIGGFTKHLKPASLYGGFNPDMQRNVAEYTTGAAKYIALNRAKRAAEKELLTNLATGNENLNRRLQAWSQGFHDTDSPAFQALNNAFNVAYIGGNLRTPTADLLGKIQLQYSLLSNYLKGLEVEKVYTRSIVKEVQWWTSSDEGFAKAHPELSAGIKEAQRKNIIPTNVYKNLVRTGRDSNKTVGKIYDLYFGIKDLTERSTDLSGFINGWDAYPYWSKRQKQLNPTEPLPSRQQFAENFAREGRAVPSQSELPALGRNGLVRTLTKYQLYKAKILKSMIDANWPARARYAVATGLTAGIMGLPFVPNVITALRAAGIEPEDELRKRGVGPATLYGPLSNALGIDFSSSAGFGEIFPGSGQNAVEKGLLGMAKAPFDQMQRMYDYYSRGQMRKAVAATPFMPNLFSNALNAYDWTQRGVVTLGGQPVIPRDQVTLGDVLRKLAGYQPLKVKEAMVLENMRKQGKYAAMDNDFINQRIGEAEGLGNYKLADQLRDEADRKGLKVDSKTVRRYRRAFEEPGYNMTVETAPRDVREKLRDYELLFKQRN